MEQIYLMSAAALSAVWFLVHTFLGGRQVARPLRQATGMTDEARVVAWMCWHFVTATLLVLTLCFGGALIWAMPGLTLAGTALAAGFVAVGTWVTARSDIGFAKAPQGLLFIPQVVLGALALL
ncbi:hypothetical protein ACMU_10425 [Actibacterium mucosum KCTC 23349]|uniref:Uncharacterized protein n=2 Tax=Actibacterium TaxID=1433986 RepID=A0A037ZJ68_9RHOB|nr:hypothetical protein ACMU_10425 [Actibacterium mucosum KCTC 23349]